MKKKVVSLVCGLAAVLAAVLVTWSGSGSTVRAAVNADGSVLDGESKPLGKISRMKYFGPKFLSSIKTGTKCFQRQNSNR